MKTNKILIRVVTLFLITLSTTCATEMVPEINYNNLSTQELEKEVERLSQSGNIPFTMGLELIERWTNS